MIFYVGIRHGFELVFQGQGEAPRLVVSKSCCQLLLDKAHCSKLSAHFRAHKMFGLLIEHVWWPIMRASCPQVCCMCQVCQYAKNSTQPLPLPCRRFGRWSIDFMTSLPLFNGNNAVMTCIVGLLGYICLIPCFMGEGELSSEHVEQLFFDSVVCMFGLPDEVLHDRDPRFAANFWRCKGLASPPHHTEVGHTLPYRHTYAHRLAPARGGTLYFVHWLQWVGSGKSISNSIEPYKWFQEFV